MFEETHVSYLVLSGLLLLVVGLVWLVVAAARTHWSWLVGMLVPGVNVIVGLVFAVRHTDRARWPLRVLLLAVILAGGPIVANRVAQRFLDLGPREKIVDGELHITVTGWDQDDYSILQNRLATVVLQMANPDVTDATLQYLRGMTSLRSLDLNDTGITDDGLAVLANLPALEELRLARTKITDDGFRAHLAGKESLRHLDLTGTPVKGKTKRAWLKARPGRKLLD